MIDTEFYIEPATWAVDQAALKAVRSAVFIEEQGIPEAEEFDDEDYTATHFLARSNDGQPIGTSRLSADGRIARIAVVAPWRGNGVGAALLRSAIEAAQGRNMTRLHLHAQAHAIAFYQRHGFVVEGEPFDEAGILHRRMRRTLSMPSPAIDSRVRRTVDANDDKETIAFDTRAGFRQALLRLLTHCRQELLIYSHNLDPAVLDTAPVAEEIRQTLTHGPHPSVRVLVVDSAAAVQHGHRLINLAQRLTSLMQLRKPSKRHRDYPSAYVVADSRHLIFREFGSQAVGELRLNDRNYAHKLSKHFNEVWEYGDIDPNLRRLDL